MQVSRDSQLKVQIPDSLRQKLLAYRRRIWTLKMFEALAAALIGVLVGFLLTYALDRVWDTPRVVRGILFAAAVFTCVAIPIAAERWILRRRRMDQLARLLSQTQPATGDQLLGVIELAADQAEQSRSPVLVEAAIAQVAAALQHHDLRSAVPRPRHRQRGWAAAILLVITVGLFLITATAARNAWARFLSPWRDTPRYTFAAVQPLPEKLVVPHGEPTALTIGLQPHSQWEPNTAEIRLPNQPPRQAQLDQRQYQFALPPLISPATLAVAVGDFHAPLAVEPVLRPELQGLQATIALPAYLGRPDPLSKPIRGATVSVVSGSQVTIAATASRQLAAASVNGQFQPVDGDRFHSPPLRVDGPLQLRLDWSDVHGLSGKQPIELQIAASEDQPPAVVCENLPARKVLLATEVLTFAARAHDDFGVKEVGIQWRGLDPAIREPATGETLIGAGSPHSESLELVATFSAAQFQIEPQPIAIRVFVQDYLPGRSRTYSAESVLEIVSAEQHAIWITGQLQRWQQMSLDVRDREMQLHATNQQLQALTAEQLAQPETRQRLITQSQQEQANGRNLSNLVQSGQSLLREAMRNSDIGAEQLNAWAKTMQTLQDISENRMPSVAELLKQASQQQAGGPETSQTTKPGAQAGQNRLAANQSPATKDGEQPDPETTNTPSISDIESSHLSPQPEPDDGDSQSPPAAPRLALPDTMLAGNLKIEAAPPAEAPPALDQAVAEQQDLLSEFDKIADELNAVLANLEGSTLVKRLKASSRKQQQVAAKLATLVPNAFGATEREKESQSETFAVLAEVEATSSLDASHIMDDMAAYHERTRMPRFQVVLDDMRDQDVTAGLRQLGDDLRAESGLSIAQAEYWSETLDRWAEDLVEATQGGAAPAGKARGSMPPALILEVMQVLDGEVNLREQTRVAEQARPARSDTEHAQAGEQLSLIQNEFQQRMVGVVQQLSDIPGAEADFAKELQLLNQVSDVMGEATEILIKPDTGPRAIAVETEIIELLLASKRFNPSGGGGASSPGGGGDGDTALPALALVGSGVNDKEVREEMSAAPSTGTSGRGLPEEFRAGLDEYFSRLEDWQK